MVAINTSYTYGFTMVLNIKQDASVDLIPVSHYQIPNVVNLSLFAPHPQPFSQR
jgi:hypothetical protein